MKRHYLIPIVILAIAISAGCDSSNPSADDSDPIDIPTRTVVYEVFGTYYACDITYRQRDGSDELLTNTPLDWMDSVKVARNESFQARVSATCADLEHDGKATIRLIVDGVLLESVSFQGFGESGTAQRLLRPFE